MSYVPPMGWDYAGDVEFGPGGGAGRVLFAVRREQTEILVEGPYGHRLSNYRVRGQLSSSEVLKNAQEHVLETQAPRGELAIGRRFEVTSNVSLKKKRGVWEVIALNKNGLYALPVLSSGKISTKKYAAEFFRDNEIGRMVSASMKAAKAPKSKTKAACDDPPNEQSHENKVSLLRAAKVGDVLCFKLLGVQRLRMYTVTSTWTAGESTTGRRDPPHHVGITSPQLQTRGSSRGGTVFIYSNRVELWAGRAETVVGVSTTKSVAKPAPKSKDYSKHQTVSRGSKLFRAVLENMTSATERYVEHDGPGYRHGPVSVSSLRSTIETDLQNDRSSKMWWDPTRREYTWYRHSNHTFKITAPSPEELQSGRPVVRAVGRAGRPKKIPKPFGRFTSTYVVEIRELPRRGDGHGRWKRVFHGSLDAAEARTAKLKDPWRIVTYFPDGTRGRVHDMSIDATFDTEQQRFEELVDITTQVSGGPREVTPFWKRRVVAARRKAAAKVKPKAKPRRRRSVVKRKRALSMAEQIKAAERALRGKK